MTRSAFGRATATVITGMSVATLLAATPAEAREFEVSDRGDHAPGACTAGDCTLREAVIAANLRPGADEILLSGGKRYELSIPSTGEDAAADGDLDITSGPLTILHRGKGTASIDANRIDRVLEIGAARTTLRKLTVRGGSANPLDAGGDGGGIAAGDFGDAPLTIVGSRIIDNRSPAVDGNGGGIDTDIAGRLRVIRSVVAGNDAGGDGGGISGSVEGPMTIERSTITGNEAGEGGGLMVVGPPATVTGTTIASNRAVGGGDGEVGDGAGIYVDDQGLLLITNSTISGNLADRSGGGIFGEPGGQATITSTTLARNRADADLAAPDGAGGGIQVNLAAFEVVNSLIALNTASGSPSDCGGTGFVASEAPNLLTTTSGGSCGGTGEIVSPNPGIGPLAANGGPTETIALRRGSPAIGAADPSLSPERDQRGVKRKDPDLGAFERE